ncbi:MAG TPA: 4-hydroxy-3-methylbut-2-enyl diphosphate reductase, partial [Firmicutes bacterium]|nr:4-hydroxy-3-methylbut-2-enyl diphosphate reductase [Bacillota bacterium]
MDIILAEHAGFCKGVKDAVEKALKSAAEKDSTPLCTLGPLVHNDDVVKMLEARHVRTYENPEDIPEGHRVIIRTHGTTPAKLQYLAEHGQTVFDATCPFVKHVQETVAREAAAGKQVVIIGDPDHPEVKGLKGWGDRVLVVPNLDSLCLEAIEPQAVIVAQTTYIPEDFNRITAAVKEARPEVKIYNTICRATSLRQEAAARIAGEVDVMIVIGSANSSNTQKLARLCRRINKNTYHISSPAELDALAWGGIRKVGVTAGASTPDWTIKEVLGEMENNLQDSQLESINGRGDLQNYQVGDKVSGKVVQINAEEVLVDIGYKTEGVLPATEIYLNPGENLRDAVKPDDVLELKIK